MNTSYGMEFPNVGYYILFEYIWEFHSLVFNLPRLHNSGPNPRSPKRVREIKRRGSVFFKIFEVSIGKEYHSGDPQQGRKLRASPGCKRTEEPSPLLLLTSRGEFRPPLEISYAQRMIRARVRLTVPIDHFPVGFRMPKRSILSAASRLAVFFSGTLHRIRCLY